MARMSRTLPGRQTLARSQRHGNWSLLSETIWAVSKMFANVFMRLLGSSLHMSPGGGATGVTRSERIRKSKKKFGQMAGVLLRFGLPVCRQVGVDKVQKQENSQGGMSR